MSIKSLNIVDFLEASKSTPVIDVRSPGEFSKGHIPGAINIPLFSDEERKIVGTLYKQESREKAILSGLEFAGAKMRSYVEEALKVCTEGKALVHCWRGGMRSKSIAFVLNTYGIQTSLLDGGYKSFRNQVLSLAEQKFRLIILGGYTGSGKTRIIHELIKAGQQAIDLEGLANHKGAAFGSINEDKQPSTEHFENLFWEKLSTLDPEKPIWLEDESLQIGKVRIPYPFYDQMRESITLKAVIPRHLRLDYLLEEYLGNDDELIEGIEKIRKRIGGLDTKKAIEAVKGKNYPLAAEIVLKYYDRSYEYGLSKRPVGNVHPVVFNTINPSEITKELINKAGALGL